VEGKMEAQAKTLDKQGSAPCCFMFNMQLFSSGSAALQETSHIAFAFEAI